MGRIVVVGAMKMEANEGNGEMGEDLEMIIGTSGF